MTQDEVIKLAKKAGFGNYAYEAAGIFERFAAMVAAAEREKCTGTQEFVTLPREVVELAIEAIGDAKHKIEFDAIDALIAALEQPQNHIEQHLGMVPAGWKLVPVEPTRDMLTTWIKAPVVSNTKAPGLYRSMLAAAPQPPTTEDPSVVQPQANQPAMTPIAQRKLDDLVASGYTISGYSVYHERKHQHGFVTGAGLVGWWKPEGMEYPQPQGEQEPVAWQYRMRPDWGIKKDCWGPWQDCTREQAAMYQRVQLLQDWVYESRQLYTHPQPRRDPLPDHYINGMFSAASLAEGDMFRRFARAIEAAHNIK